MATAPRTISQRIALEGAEELQKQLEAIGKTGEDAFKRNADAITLAARRLEGFVRVVANVETAFANIGGAVGRFSQALGGVGTAFNAFQSSVGSVVRNLALLAGGGGLIGAAAVGLGKFAANAAKASDDTQENAAAIGLSTEAYRRLQFATESAGLKQGQFQQVMARLNDQFSDAKKAQTAFAVAQQRSADGVQFTDEQIKKLTDSVTDSKNIFTRFRIDLSRGLGLEEAVLRAGDALKGLRSDQERAAAGFDLFGARGARAGTALAGIREAVKGTREEFGLLQTIEKRSQVGVAAAESLEKLTKVAKDAKQALGLVFSPVLQTAADGLRQAILRNFGTLDEFAQSIEQKVRPVVEDLIRLLSGDTANIQNRWIVEARDKIVEFGAAVGKVITSVVLPAFRALMEGADLVAQGINRIFGTNLTGTDVAIIAAIGKLTGVFDSIVKAANLAAAAVILFFAALRVPAAVLSGLALIGGAPAVVAAAFATAAAAIILNWGKIKDAGIAAWDEINRKWNVAPTQSGAEALPAGQSGLDLLLERLQQKAIEVWEVIRAKWTQNPVPKLPDDKFPITLIFERLQEKAITVWEAIRAKWSESPIPKLPDDRLPIEIIFERLLEKAQSTWDTIREIWSRSPIGDQTALPAGQSALSLFLSGGNKETEAVKKEVAAIETLVSGVRTLTPELTKGATAQDTIAAATAKATQAAAQNAQAITQAAQSSQAATNSATQFAAKIGTVEISKPFAAGSRSIEEVQRRLELAKNVVSQFDLKTPTQGFADLQKTVRDLATPIKTLKSEGRDLATPFKTLRDEAGKVKDLSTPLKTLDDDLANAGKSAKDLAAPFKALGDEAAKVGPKIITIGDTAPKITEVETSVTGLTEKIGAAAVAAQTAGTQISTAMSAAAEDIKKATSQLELPALQGQLPGLGSEFVSPGVAPAAVDTGPFAKIVAQAQAARNQVIQIFSGLMAAVDQALLGGAAVAGPLAVPAAGAQVQAAPTAAASVGPFSAIVQQAQRAKDQIVAIFSGLQAAIAQAISGGAPVAPGGAPGAVAAEGVAAAVPAEGATGGPFQGLIAQAQAAVAAIAQVFAQLGSTLAGAFQPLEAAIGAAIGRLVEMVSGVGSIGPAFSAMASEATSALQQVIQKLEEAILKANELSRASQSGFGGGGGVGFAAGGYTGSGPIKKIAGFVHGREYVTPAHITRRPGVLSFLEQLRRVGDLESVIARFARGFDVGGLVGSFPVSRPSFAAASPGNINRNLGTVFLKTDSGQSFRVFTDDDTAAALTRFAVRANNRSAGRPPSRVG